MMAALPSEARDKVMNDKDYWLGEAYKEYYGIPNFQHNPMLVDGVWDYARALKALDLTDVVLIIDSLLAERHNG